MPQGIFSSLGIGSGLNSGQLVEQLVAAERAPRENRLNRSEQIFRTQLSAIGRITAALDSLNESTGGLTNIADARTVRSSDRDIVTVTASEGAPLGSFRVEVERLAEAHSVASGSFASEDTVVGTGTLTLASGSNFAEITIDAENNTLGGIRDAINAADAGVTAVIVDNGSGSQLLLSSELTGVDNVIEINITDDDGNNLDTSGLSALAYNASAQNLTETVAAVDSLIKVNGLQITNASNEIDGAIEGYTLELQSAEPGTDVNITVERNDSAASSSVSSFVEDLSTLFDQIDTLTAYDPETQRAGALQGDSTTRSLLSTLRSALIENLGGDATSTFDNLVSIGITTAADGSIELDEEVFQSALDENFEDVSTLLGVVSTRFEDIITRFDDENGLLGARTDSLNLRLEDIADRRIALDERIAVIEARYVREFSALDTLISQLQNTGNYLSSQLANLPTAGQNSRNR